MNDIPEKYLRGNSKEIHGRLSNEILGKKMWKHFRLTWKTCLTLSEEIIVGVFEIPWKNCKKNPSQVFKSNPSLF